MKQTKPIAAAAVPAITHVLAHWGRVAIFLMSFGFLYPNVMTEGMNLTALDSDNETKAKDRP